MLIPLFILAIWMILNRNLKPLLSSGAIKKKLLGLYQNKINHINPSMV